MVGRTGPTVASVAACTNTQTHQSISQHQSAGSADSTLCGYRGRTALAPQTAERVTIKPEKVRADANAHEVNKWALDVFGRDVCILAYFLPLRWIHTANFNSPPRIWNLAEKVTVGLASHWPCVTDNSGITTYGLMALGREMSTPPKLQ